MKAEELDLQGDHDVVTLHKYFFLSYGTHCFRLFVSECTI